MRFAAESFWFFFFAASCGVGIVLFVLARRMSSGEKNAGPLIPEPVMVAGLAEASLDLVAIDQHLARQPQVVVDLLHELAAALDVDAGRPPSAPHDAPSVRLEAERLLGVLEHQVFATDRAASPNPYPATAEIEN
ncbi:MAG: hypothetical protein ACI8TP_000393 [Acidimicrobiales bacterium]